MQRELAENAINAFNDLTDDIRDKLFAYFEPKYSGSRIQFSIEHIEIDNTHSYMVEVHYEEFCMGETDRDILTFPLDWYFENNIVEKLRERDHQERENEKRRREEAEAKRREAELEKARRILSEAGEL